MVKEARVNVDVETPRLDAKMDELRELIRQANEALKDIKAATKEARAIAAESAETLRKEFADKFETCAKDTLDEWAKVTLRGIEMAESRINARFDKLGNILMGEEGKGKPPLTDLVRDWMERRETP